MKNSNQLSLFELSQKIADALELGFPTTVWVVAEISDFNENRSGHCYLELVEKDDDKMQPKAKARAIIWAWSYRMLKPFFESATGRKLASGIKVLVNCNVTYHPVYGLSLNIIDIDPAFTIGDIEQKRQQVIGQLIQDGIIDMNKECELPVPPKRIAIISSPTAAGYQDFTNQIDTNSYGYSISYTLFSAIMQGEKAEESIIESLNAIHNRLNDFDAVVIIRGGGSQIDLGCFDGYELACNIAQFPIPVLTGIGHERDISIADMVAHTRLKTPTAVAEFLINRFVEAESWLNDSVVKFSDEGGITINNHVYELNQKIAQIIPTLIKLTNVQKIYIKERGYATYRLTQSKLHQKNMELNGVKSSVSKVGRVVCLKQNYLLGSQFQKAKTKIIELVKFDFDKLTRTLEKAESFDPRNIIKRGYTITTINGKSISKVNQINIGDTLKTLSHSFSVTSTVDEVEMSK